MAFRVSQCDPTHYVQEITAQLAIRASMGRRTVEKQAVDCQCQGNRHEL